MFKLYKCYKQLPKTSHNPYAWTRGEVRGLLIFGAVTLVVIVGIAELYRACGAF